MGTDFDYSKVLDIIDELKNLHNNEKDFNCPLCECNIIITQSVIIYFLKILIINFKRI